MKQRIALATLVRKEVSRVLRIWVQTLVPPVITMTLYFIIFGTFIGSQVSGVKGFTYMQFIVPGVILMAVITNSYTNVASSFFGTKFQRAIEEILVSPMSNSGIIIGFALGGVARGVIVGILVTIVALFFTTLHVTSILFIILFVVLTAMVFSLAGMLNGVFAKSFDDVSIIPTFVLTPLTYLGGVFYPISALPPFWQTLSKLNPIVYMVDGLRYGFLGISDVNVFAALGMLLVFTILLFVWLLVLFRRGTGLRS